jgi:hypothetical protein
MQGQKIAMAASTPTRPGDTALEIKDFEFKTEKLGTGAPRWRAQLRTAKVRLQAVEQVKGAGLDSAIVEFHPKYVEDGFTDKNAASEVFVRLKEVVKLDYGAGAGADRSGGLVTPNMEISGISRKTGPIGGDLTGGNPPPKFKPGDFFKGATILGGIPLEEILKVTGFDKAPELLSRTIYPGDDTSLPPEAVETTLTWSLKGTADLKPDALKLFEPLSNASLDITAMFRAPVNGEPDYEIVGDLRNFKIHMIGKPSAFLILTFNKLTFTSKKGKSPDVDVDIEEVVFAGILTFVNELKDFMNFGGNGLSIDVTPTAIDAGYTLTLPNISVGIFSLQNISLFAGVKIPFTGKPVSARFAFCRPDAQFLLTYTIFGGGGFVQLTVGEDPKTHDFGMQLLEAGMEFGANASIDIGVASGGVHIMAGIYFAIGTTEDCDDPIAQLSGYVRLGGELDVMGIISISLEFRMGLTYDFNEDVVWGQATLVVEVDVLLFSGSVELTVEKRFGGGGDGDEHLCTPGGSSPRAAIGTFTHATAPQPITFGDLMTADEWTDEYAAAFAPEAFV